ncbi:MAG: DNA topoisomerase IB [Geminicoccaceae bacterium]|nr:DNA topoisomerase IB [Geminicoccaceae bacterium]
MLADTDPRREAKAAGLRYVSDETPGITRKRRGKGFSYYAPDGSLIADPAERKRLDGLAIPPAYTDVWICPNPKGHLQATGRDERGRKQYRYHDDWTALREEAKFEHVLAFGRALPGMRAAVLKDMARPRLDERKVLATIVRLLETTLIRVGNDEYARANRHYGLTTLKRRHLTLDGASMRFSFVGKSGQAHEVEIRDRRVAKAVKRIQELPGQDLFQYLDEEGGRRRVDSAEVNAYLAEIAGDHFTAKDFRTWAGTVLAALALSEFETFDNETAAKRNVRHAVERVARRLGNTPTVCRKAYIHPEILSAYLDGTLVEMLKAEVEAVLKGEIEGLEPEEAAVLAFLQKRLETLAGDG